MRLRDLIRSIEDGIKYHPLIAPRYLRAKARRHIARGEPELRLLPFLVPPGCTAIDVGANKGIYTLALSALAGQVHAFEPNPLMVARLGKGLPANVRLHHLALSDRAGKATLAVPRTSKGRLGHVGGSLRADKAGTNTEKFSVQSERLDTFDIHGLGFIKIDVEGFEEQVLAGATGTLARERPVIQIELEERHTGRGIGELIASIEVLGYQSLFLQQGLLRTLAAFEPARDHDPDRPGYVKDFIFLPRED